MSIFTISIVLALIGAISVFYRSYNMAKMLLSTVGALYISSISIEGTDIYDTVFTDGITTIVASVLTLLSIFFFYKIFKLRYNGILSGIFNSILIGLVFTNRVMITTDENSITSLLGFIIFLMIFATIFISGFETIKPIHKRIPLFMNKMLANNLVFNSGPMWWFNNNLFGGTFEFNVERQLMPLFDKDEEALVINGLKLKKSPISLYFKIDEKNLFDIIESGDDFLAEIKTLAENNVSSTAKIMTNNIREDILKNNYFDYKTLFLVNETYLLNTLSIYGIFFNSHHEYPQLLENKIYLSKVVNAYEKEFGKKVSNKKILEWFSPEIAQKLKIKTISDENMNIFNKNLDNSQFKGLMELFKDMGIFVYELKFGIFEISDRLRNMIYERKAVKTKIATIEALKKVFQT